MYVWNYFGMHVLGDHYLLLAGNGLLWTGNCCFKTNLINLTGSMLLLLLFFDVHLYSWTYKHMDCCFMAWCTGEVTFIVTRIAPCKNDDRRSFKKDCIHGIWCRQIYVLCRVAASYSLICLESEDVSSYILLEHIEYS